MKREDPLVSVVIAVFNGGERLQEALQSVFEQTYSPLEVIVVDDGSTDTSRHIIASFSTVRYIYQENGGVASARNKGINAATGDLIAFLDHDDLWHRKKIELQVALMQANKALGLTWTKSNILVEAGTVLPPWCTAEVLRRDSVSLPSSWLIRRELLERSLLFDEDLQSHEDIEWLSRLFRAKVPRQMLSEVLVYRRLHGGNLSFQYDDHRELLKILKMIIEKKRISERSSSG